MNAINLPGGLNLAVFPIHVLRTFSKNRFFGPITSKSWIVN